MGDFITALTSSTGGLSASAFTGQLTSLVPFLVIMIPLAFGYKVIKKSVKGASGAKVRI